MALASRLTRRLASTLIRIRGRRALGRTGGLGLVLAALAGPAWAQGYEAGMTAYEAGDYGRAVSIWEPLAESGDAIAQYSLGKIYETGGLDVEKDEKRAAEWYRQAAGQGVAAAQNNLGLMYAQGRGVDRDPARAVELWAVAAQKNHPMAQFNLALAYFRGEGVQQDRAQAERWFRQAAELGLPDAQYAMGQFKRLGLTAEPDKGEALTWYQLAAAQGHDKAKDQADLLRREGTKPRLGPTPEPEGGSQTAEGEPGAAPGAEGGQTETKDDTGAAPATVEKAEGPPLPPPSGQKPQAEGPPLPPPSGQKPQAEASRPTMPQTAAEPEAPGPAAPAEPRVARGAGELSPADGPSTEATTGPSTEAPTEPITEGAAEPASEPASEPATAALPETIGPGRYRAWLLSAKSEGAALSYLRQVEEKHPDLLGAVRGAVVPADFGAGRVFYRVVAGGLASREAGRAFCQRLQAAEPTAFCKVLATTPD